MREMEIRQLRYFVAVAEELHFRGAARRLRVAQPSLSTQIRQLEEELGVTLLARTNRQVQLTQAGTVFLDRCRKVLASLDQAAEDAKHAVEGLTGTLRIGFASTASFVAVPRLVKLLRRALPLASVALEEHPPASLFALLEEKKLDLVLTQAMFVPSTLASKRVARERLVAVLAKTHALARQEAVRPSELRGELLFLPARASTPALYESMVRVFSRAGGLPERTQVVEQVQTAITLAANGLGVVLVPESAGEFLPPAAKMLPLQPDAVRVDLLAVWRRDAESALLERARQLLRRV